MRKWVVFLFAAIVSWPTYSSASPQKDAVRRFYELREKMLDQHGTIFEVNELLSLMTDDVKYEHPLASVTMTKSQARSGMLTHLGEGQNTKYTIRRAHFVDDFAVVEFVLEYRVKGKRISHAGVATFEFTGNKISRVAEY
jgi:SnoaL-like domain